MKFQIGLDDTDFAVVAPFGFVVDTDDVVVVAGAALRRMLDVSPGSPLGEHFQIVRPWGIDRFATLPAQPSGTVVLRARRNDLELKGCKVALEGGRKFAFFASPVVRDIDEFQLRGLQLSDFSPSDATPDLLLSMQATRSALSDAKKLGTELQVALASARSAAETKARFLAVMSHEIRTPLNGFGSMIDLLRDSPLGPDQQENLATMDLCARSLQALVGDILEYSKLEAGKIEIHRTPCAGVDTLQRIVDHFRAAARERGLELALQIELPTGVWLYIDAQRVRQIVTNLIGNSLKFTANGHVAVGIARTTDGLLAIDVVDTGIGIPEASRNALFEPFVQADSSTTRRFGGTGLGLSISRQLARAMGGDVQLVRSDNHGSWFRCTILAPTCEPPTASNETTSSQASPAPLRNRRVLVADDDGTNRLVASKLLRKLGIDASVVENGIQAVEAAAREHYDLILMDMMMPQLNGIEATTQIRAGNGPCRSVPILAFSAAAFEADREAAAQAGMDGFIEKPARLDALREALRPHLG